MIIIELQGGLGNQMFQYAFGRALSILKKTDLLLDLSFYNENNGSEIADREFLLNNFSIKAQIATDYNLYFFNKKKQMVSFKEKLIKKLFIFENIQEKNLMYNHHIWDTKKNAYLTGYWQSERYFNFIEETIRTDFNFKVELNEKQLEILNKIQQVNSVSIHIRRGDYLKESMPHGSCSLEYYSKAISLISEKLKDPYYFIFSDDSKWVEEKFKNSSPYFIVKDNSAVVDLMLMSNCKSHIIANSTFSWWGAWLSQNKSKLVIAPKTWFINEPEKEIDIIPNSWIKIKNI